MGHKNLGKVLVPRVVSMAEESITEPRRPHARTVRPHQWHIARGGLTAEGKFLRGVGPDMIEGVVAAPTFNVSHQTPSCIYVKKTPKQYCLSRRNSQGTCEGV